MTLANEPSIHLESASKRYRKYEDSPALVHSLRNLVKRTKRSEVVAVRDVSLDIPAGAAVGLIGRNGAGKSTLLQMIAGITSPSSGRVRVTGRVAPLISVGVGFHPELTGRENVYVNAAILGLTRPEIDSRFDEIVDFSGIEDFIDTPVKFYSSGMSVRLGFSVALQVHPDIFLVDEVLGVGDLAFQMKCYERIQSVIKSGATALVVSHNLTVVRHVCERVVVIEKGAVSYDGAPADAIDHFHGLLSEDRDPEGSDLGWVRHLGGQAAIAIESLTNGSGERTTTFTSDESLVAELSVEALSNVEGGFLGVTVYAADGTLVYADAMDHNSTLPLMAAGERKSMSLQIGLNVPTGTYLVSIALYQLGGVQGGVTLLAQTKGQAVHVQGRAMVQGAADLRASFGGADS